MSFWKWSRTAANNATTDSSINWAEGQAPSTVNDSARAMMAAAAKYRDDIAGAIATGGTSTAYTLTSYQSFDTLAHMDGAMIARAPLAADAIAMTEPSPREAGRGRKTRSTVSIRVRGTGLKRPLTPTLSPLSCAGGAREQTECAARCSRQLQT